MTYRINRNRPQGKVVLAKPGPGVRARRIAISATLKSELSARRPANALLKEGVMSAVTDEELVNLFARFKALGDAIAATMKTNPDIAAAMKQRSMANDVIGHLGSAMVAELKSRNLLEPIIKQLTQKK